MPTLVDVTVDRDTGRRTLVAKRRFEAGEVLATDSPLIVWSQAEAGLLKAFQASDQQDAILSLYAPALDRQDDKIDDRRKKGSFARADEGLQCARQRYDSQSTARGRRLRARFPQAERPLRDGVGFKARLRAELPLSESAGREHRSHVHTPHPGRRDAVVFIYWRALGPVHVRKEETVTGEFRVFLRAAGGASVPTRSRK